MAFNSAISACGRCRQWARALDVLRHMAHEGLVAQPLTLSALIRACRGVWRCVLHLLELLSRGWELRATCTSRLEAR